VRQVRHHIRDRAVDVVVGFGGYASAPAYVAARRTHVPVVVHEANAKPGLANVLRVMARSRPVSVTVHLLPALAPAQRQNRKLIAETAREAISAQADQRVAL
jgi:UDP-N-acetylglucosamine:LPS N-acetylglucosamine transferase